MKKLDSSDNEYIQRYFDSLVIAKSDDEIKEILNALYDDGFEDGQNTKN